MASPTWCARTTCRLLQHQDSPTTTTFLTSIMEQKRTERKATTARNDAPKINTRLRQTVVGGKAKRTRPNPPYPARTSTFRYFPCPKNSNRITPQDLYHPHYVVGCS
ncbi:unnamed protein product, partial [Ectocarpus fasciculatus]